MNRGRMVTGVVAAALAAVAVAGCGSDDNGGQNGGQNGAQNASASASAGASNAAPAPGANGQQDPAAAAAQELQGKLDEAQQASPIKFEKESTKLTEQSKAAIKKVAEAAAPAQQVKLTVTAAAGYTDQQKAMEVSQQRADAVKKQLAEDGVGEDRVTAKGAGSEGITSEDQALTVKITAGA